MRKKKTIKKIDYIRYLIIKKCIELGLQIDKDTYCFYKIFLSK